MAKTNHAAVYEGPHNVEVKSMHFPEFVEPRRKKIEHGAIMESRHHQYLRK